MFDRRCFKVAICASQFICCGALAQSVSKLATFSAWSLYADDQEKHAFCFVTSEPKVSAPSNVNRDSPRVYISAWPKDGIKTEISFRLGFPIKADAEIKAKTDAGTFKMFAKSDRAYVKDPTQELKLLEAMKKGATLSTEATSERGTLIADTYTLFGIGQALENMQKSCF